jgi:hypothetical protein
MIITDDELLLYYYRDGLEPEERARIGAALAAQPELAQRLHRLVARLDAVSASPAVDVPEKYQQRWKSALDAAAGEGSRAKTTKRARFSSPMLFSAAAILAAVAFAVVFQFRGDPRDAKAPVTAANHPAATREQASAYEAGLKVHLASTEQQIAGLRDATPEERAKLIDTIIGQNQMYALAAERAGEPQLARVLRAFTPVLEDVASGRAQSTNGNLAQLGFELRVMQARLSADARTPTTL